MLRLQYVQPYMRKRINCVPIHDDGGELLSNENLSIFSHLGWLLSNNAILIKNLTNIKFWQAYYYVLFNYNELRHFVN
jgi:hypothetical protein